MPYVLPREAATVRTAKHGEFCLGILSIRALQMIAEIDADLAPHEYCVQVLHVVVQTPPERDVETLRRLPDGILQRLAREFAASRHGLNKPLPAKRPVFVSFKNAILGYLNEEQQRLHKTLEGMRISLNGAMVPIAQQLTSVLLPSITADLSRGINRDLLATLHTLTPPPLMLAGFKPAMPTAALTSLSKSIVTMADAIARMPMLPFADMARQVAALQQSTYWTQQSRSYLADIARIAANGSMTAQLAPLFRAASAMSLTFGTYFDDVRSGLANPPGVNFALDTEVVVPAQTSAVALGTVKAIGTRVVSGGRRETPTPNVLASPNQLRSNIDEYFARLQPRFVAQWHGAWEALGSNNPDRLRQAAHSARELLAQVLHELAPDSAFSAEELRQCDGKPTRKMRVAKILHVNTHSSKVALIESQARLTDEMYGILSGVAHAHDTIDEGEIAGYLMSLDGVLLILLSHGARNT